MLQKTIKKLVILWIQFGKNSEVFFKAQVDSIYFDEQTLIQRSLMDSFSIADLVNKSEDSFLQSSNGDDMTIDHALNDSR